MNTAVELHQYFGQVDPLARRYLQILESFKEAIGANTVTRAAPTNPKAGVRDIFPMFFRGWPDGILAAGLSRGLQTQADRNSTQMDISTGCNGWGSFQGQTGGTGQQQVMGGDMMQQIPVGSDFSGINPPDFSLNFDAFLSGVNQGPTYQQDLWMPLYGTMGMD
jgi:hypothetical protein